MGITGAESDKARYVASSAKASIRVVTLCRAEQFDAAMGGAVRDAHLLEPAVPSATRHVFVGLCSTSQRPTSMARSAESLATRILAAKMASRWWPDCASLRTTMIDLQSIVARIGASDPTRWCQSALYRNDAYRATARCQSVALTARASTSSSHAGRGFSILSVSSVGF
jgi:hypothetical protein